MALMIRMSIADILLVEKIIDTHMKEKNIKNINDIDEKVIQERYDEIMKKQMWSDPESFISNEHRELEIKDGLVTSLK